MTHTQIDTNVCSPQLEKRVHVDRPLDSVRAEQHVFKALLLRERRRCLLKVHALNDKALSNPIVVLQSVEKKARRKSKIFHKRLKC